MKELPRLTDPELEIMQIVWENGEMSIGDVLERYNAERKDAEKVIRTTIQVQMVRLEEKGWLSHREDGRTFRYRATRKKDTASRDIIRDISERVFSGSTTELVKHLLGSKPVDPQELEKLKKLINEYGK